MDWKTTIAWLQERGLSQTQIASACECGQATISGLVTGATADPRFSTGRALLELVERVQSEQPDAPPPPQSPLTTAAEQEVQRG